MCDNNGTDNDHWLGCLDCGEPVKLTRYNGHCLRLRCPACGREFVWYAPPPGGEVDGLPGFVAERYGDAEGD